jgi:hypothetical protein
MKLLNFASGKTPRSRTGALVAALAVAVGLGGCSASYVENNDAPVLLIVTNINGGAVLDSDVRIGASSNVICEDEVPVGLKTQMKNPMLGDPSALDNVLLKSYEVRYFRTDGRGVEGVDVPYRITGSVASSVQGESSVLIEVVRRQAKMEPPLSTIYQTTVLTVMAEVTIYGETVSGRRVSASGRFQIDFADYGDTGASCPGN